jgi:hypothetical protein
MDGSTGFPHSSEPEITGIDGTVRKAHYGQGRQPWDDIKDWGWAPGFAAGNVVKYIRRHTLKNGADDLAKARWYWAELKALTKPDGRALQAYHKLRLELSAEELALLGETK